MNTKVTKRESYNTLIEVLAAARSAGVEADFDTLEGFVAHEIELLDNKAAKVKANATKNKAADDSITDMIKDILTDKPQTIAEVTAAIDNADITSAKVSYRLTQLAKNGFATKEEVTVAGGEGQKSRKLVAYKIAD